jgi:hypothetical protein
MFGLVAVAAVAAMAFVGASSAMAESTVLCSTTENPCASHALTNTHVEGKTAVGADTTLVAGSLTVLCTETGGVPASIILGEVLTLAAPLIGHFSLIDFNNCKRGTEACEVNTIKLGLLELLRNGGDSGTAKSSGSEVLVKCGSFIHCVYGGTPSLTAAGGAPGTITATNAVLTVVSGFFCPEESKWTATYTIALPNPVHIEK